MGQKPVVNLDELQLVHHQKGLSFEAQTARIANLIGARQLGAAIQIIAPGKAAWPRHAHHANEELFLILEGTGIYRVGEDEWAIRAGDVIAAPVGGADSAHQIRNTGKVPLRCFCVSTNHPIDVIEYPDSGKLWMAADMTAETGMGRAPTSHIWHTDDLRRDYWSGEA